MQKALDDGAQSVLRQEKIITDSEVAFQIGDKFIAENILTKSRREIHVPTRIFEGTSNKRVLKG
tara:strand:+ start:110 stop:301 length:192 start_codon:yes stop_codon:yes gene_type:complete